MGEGGTIILTSFLRRQCAQRVIVTVAPMFVGGTAALSSLAPEDQDTHARSDFPRLDNIQQRWYGEDLVLEGDPVWPVASE